MRGGEQPFAPRLCGPTLGDREQNEVILRQNYEGSNYDKKILWLQLLNWPSISKE